MRATTDKPQLLSPKERRLRNREEVMAAILDRARAIMREEGVAALNLNEVARRVGMRTPSLYEYFAGKTAIYDALFLIGVRLFRERMEGVFERHSSFWDRFYASMEAYFKFAQEYPELYHLVFERPVPGFVPSEESLRESVDLFEFSARMIGESMEGAGIRPGMTVSEAVHLGTAMMHGITALHMANEPDLPPGSGRFGSLLPAAVDLFKAAWGLPGVERSGPPAHDAPQGDALGQ